MPQSRSNKGLAIFIRLERFSSNLLVGFRQPSRSQPWLRICDPVSPAFGILFSQVLEVPSTPDTAYVWPCSNSLESIRLRLVAASFLPTRQKRCLRDALVFWYRSPDRVTALKVLAHSRC